MAQSGKTGKGGDLFAGFTEETVEFLWGLRFNNRRDWFQPRKEIYLTSLYQPMLALSDELLSYLQKKRPDAALMRKVSRIYRDARRLFGRGPYKDHLWLSIEQPREGWQGKPTYWFEVSPDGWSCGLGYWQPPPETMAKLRAKISRDPAAMEKLTRRVNRSQEFSLDIVEYKRPKAPPPSELLAPWYRAKSVTIIHEEAWTELLYGRELVDRLEKDFRFLLPFFDYLQAVEAEPDPKTL